MAATIDAGFPKSAIGTVAGTVTSVSFSTSAAGLLVAVVTADGTTSTSFPFSITDSGISKSVAWTRAISNPLTSNSSLAGQEIWYCVTSAAVSAQTVTATVSASLKPWMSVYSISGAPSTSPIGATAATAPATSVAAQVAITMTGANLFVGAFTNYTAGAAITALANTTLDYTETANGDAVSHGHGTATGSGSITVGDSAPVASFSCACAIEILPAPTFPPDVAFWGPASFQRNIWNPERTLLAQPVGPMSQVVVVPKDPVPPLLPDFYARPPWSPERSHASWVWVPPPPWTQAPPPLLPESFLRGAWNPERSGSSWVWVAPPVVVPASAFGASGGAAVVRVFLDRSFSVGPVVVSPPQVSVSASVTPGTVGINQPFMITATMRNPGTTAIYVTWVVALSSPQTSSFSEATTPDVAGNGQVVVGQGLVPVNPGSSRTFTWWGVAFAVGSYALSASLIDSQDRYYQMGSVPLTVVGP